MTEAEELQNEIEELKTKKAKQEEIDALKKIKKKLQSEMSVFNKIKKKFG